MLRILYTKIYKTVCKRYPFSKKEFQVGRGTYGKPKIYNKHQDTTLKIGSYCSIAQDVKIILGGNHRLDWVTTYPFPLFWSAAEHIKDHIIHKGDVVIGNDVWIGFGATFLSGVTIGDGAVIGAGAVVSKDVRPYAVVIGNPAREVKMRFEDDVIEELLKIKWWNWDENKIQQMMPYLLTNNIHAFIRKATE